MVGAIVFAATYEVELNAEHFLLRYNGLRSAGVQVKGEIPLRKIVGLFLSSIGVGFFALLLFVAVSGQLNGNVAVAVFLFSAGALTLAARMKLG